MSSFFLIQERIGVCRFICSQALSIETVFTEFCSSANVGLIQALCRGNCSPFCSVGQMVSAGHADRASRAGCWCHPTPSLHVRCQRKQKAAATAFVLLSTAEHTKFIAIHAESHAMQHCSSRADFGRGALAMWPLSASGPLPALVLATWLLPVLGWPPAAWPSGTPGQKGPSGTGEQRPSPARKGPQPPRRASQEGDSAAAEPGLAPPVCMGHMGPAQPAPSYLFKGQKQKLFLGFICF